MTARYSNIINLQIPDSVTILIFESYFYEPLEKDVVPISVFNLFTEGDYYQHF